MPSRPLTVRGLPANRCTAASAAPTAPPASPAAGWIQMLSKAPSRSSLPLATQFSATPPARQRLRLPVRLARLRASRSTTSSSTACTDAAMSMWNGVSNDSGPRTGSPNSAAKRSLVMVRPVQ